MSNKQQNEDTLRILHVVPTFFPAVAFGGPIFSTRAICDGTSELSDLAVEVLTTDAASGKKGDRIELSENPVLFPGGYSVRYCQRDAGVSISLELLLRLPRAILRSNPHSEAQGSCFPIIPTLFLCRLFGRPVVWSPRGGFQATEQWINAPRRGLKILFERLSNFVRPRRTTLHVTAKEESEFSRRRLGDIEMALIPNCVSVPETLPERVWRPEGKLRIVFLSRVHEKKGLDDLIEAMALLPNFITLDIYGDGNGKYVASLKQSVAQLGCEDRIRFRGHVDGDDKTRAFVDADLFCLPTHSENFGIVVAEALAHGTPVVTTVNAPWQRIEEEGCGLWVESEPQALARAILSLEDMDLGEMGARGRSWMRL